MVDENILKMTVRALSARGDDLLEIRGTECEGIPEDQVWQISQDQKRLFNESLTYVQHWHTISRIND